MRQKLALVAGLLMLLVVPAYGQGYGYTYDQSAYMRATQENMPLGLPHVSSSDVVDVNFLKVDAGLDYGNGIEGNSQNEKDFDATRFLVGVGYGLQDSLEVGGRLAYESNSGEYIESGWNEALKIDDGGLDYVQAYAKYLFTQQVAGEAFIAFAGDNKVYHGMDNIDFGLKAIFSSDMGMGILHGELGWISKGGKHDLGGEITRLGANQDDYDNVFTYGLGYEYPYRSDLSIVGEIYGWQSPYDQLAAEANANGFDNYLMLDAGAKYMVADDLALTGLIGAGLSKGAPNWMLYAGVSKLFDMGTPYQRGDYQSGTQPTYQPPATTTQPPATTTQPTYQPPTTSQPAYQPPAQPVVSPQEQARQALERGNLAFQNRDYNGAAVEYKTATQADPQNGLAHYNLGVAYYYLGRYNDAVSEYQSAIGINPNDVESHLYLGLAYYQLGDTSRAITEWQRVLQLDPNNQTAQNNLKALGAY